MGDNKIAMATSRTSVSAKMVACITSSPLASPFTRCYKWLCGGLAWAVDVHLKVPQTRFWEVNTTKWILPLLYVFHHTNSYEHGKLRFTKKQPRIKQLMHRNGIHRSSPRWHLHQNDANRMWKFLIKTYISKRTLKSVKNKFLLRFSQTCEFLSSKANWWLRFSLPSIILTDHLGNKTLL